MLTIHVPAAEYYDHKNEEFIKVKSQTLRLEHSLVSLSKWESKWHRPFLKGDKTTLELVDYIRCMTITQNVDPNVYFGLTKENVEDIIEYIDNPMSGTTVVSPPGKKQGTVLSAEVIYYYMIKLGIPFECQTWHLNRLFKLIEVCAVMEAPEETMSPAERNRYNKELNARRKAELKTKG